MTLDAKKCLAPCGECKKRTYHNILHSVCRNPSSDITNRYYLLQCGGCDSVSMAHTYTSPHSKDVTYYPSPIARILPDWMLEFEIGLIGGEKEAMIGQLLGEVYGAMRGGQYRLATMGIRSVIEQVMIAKVGDHGNFCKNLAQFYDAGYISLMQRDALDISLAAGHAATHRSFSPTEQDLDFLLNITEGILASIYIHPDQAEFISNRVPPHVSSSGSGKKVPT